MSEYNYVGKSVCSSGEAASEMDEFEAGEPAFRRESGVRTISETPVSVYRDNSYNSGLCIDAPRKSVVFVSRTQVPPPESLDEKWSLESYGMEGSYGYTFKYETGELYLYQLKDSIRDGGAMMLTNAATFSSNDWGVLCMTMPDFLWSEPSSSVWRIRSEDGLDYPPTVEELGERKILFSAVWETKSSGTDRWYFRASLRSSKKKPNLTFFTYYPASPTSEADIFVLESFNTDCGVYTPMLILPIDAWRAHMGKVKDKINNLFHRCRGWQNMLIVKKELSFEEAAPTSV